MPEWMELVYESKIIHGYFTDKEAKLAFVWSRMISVDDCSSTKKYERSRCGRAEREATSSSWDSVLVHMEQDCMAVFKS